ncbi:MAG: porphobilinogen synthase, partial [Chloroflexota bacterium]
IVAEAARPVLSYFTADEHALFLNEALADPGAMERESLVAARRAGADLVVTNAALDTTEA